MPVSFSATVREGTGAPRLVVTGEVDMYSAPRLKQIIGEVTSGGAGGGLDIDIREVEFIDSTGLGVIVGALKRVREAGGDLVLEGASPAVRRVLEITGIDKVVPLRD